MNQSFKAWMSRLSFSFLIVAVVLAWEAYAAQVGRRPDAPPWRAPVFAVISGLLFVLFGFSLRMRHRRDE